MTDPYAAPIAAILDSDAGQEMLRRAFDRRPKVAGEDFAPVAMSAQRKQGWEDCIDFLRSLAIQPEPGEDSGHFDPSDDNLPEKS